jgi:Carboxypeptidase regulatory-like domain
MQREDGQDRTSILQSWVWVTMLLTLAAFLMPATLPAQSTALLTGTVVDPSGAVVPHAKVLCRNTETGQTSTATTNSQGLFRFPDLQIGSYEITISHPGFEELKRTGLQLLTGHSVDLRLQLSVGGTRQSVQVSGAAPVVQPTSSVMQTTIASRDMRDLPLNGRNPLQLVALTPGATLSSEGTEGNQGQNPGVSANGLPPVDNNYELDGVTYMNRNFSSPTRLPNPDALQEFTMKSSNFSASQGGPGATMLVSTRSGTNQFHGDAFEFLRNNVFDSRNFFSPDTSSFKRNQFGMTLGGPIQKDKTFIFGSYQGTREVGAGSSSITTVPSAAERNGDYSASPKIIVDPMTGLPFSDNVIPQDRIDPKAAQLF